MILAQQQQQGRYQEECKKGDRENKTSLTSFVVFFLICWLDTLFFTCFCCFTTGVLNILFATGENILVSSSTAVLLVVRRGAFVDLLGVFAVGVVRALSFVIQPAPRRPRLRFCDENLFLSKSHSRIFSSQTFEAAVSFGCVHQTCDA